MTDRQEHILRIIADPVHGDWRKGDRLAVTAAIDERDALLAACEAFLEYHGTPLDEIRRPLGDLLDMARAAVAKARPVKP